MIGANGTNGTNGDDGKSVLNGSSDPTSNDGAEGDFGLTPVQIPFGDQKQPMVGQVLEQIWLVQMAQMGTMVNLY